MQVTILLQIQFPEIIFCEELPALKLSHSCFRENVVDGQMSLLNTILNLKKMSLLSFWPKTPGK
jgi:hypothetical protein